MRPPPFSFPLSFTGLCLIVTRAGMLWPSWVLGVVAVAGSLAWVGGVTLGARWGERLACMPAWQQRP